MNATSATSWSITSTGTLPVVRFAWTWREAIEIAAREATGRRTVRKEGQRWAVRWSATPVMMNYS